MLLFSLSVSTRGVKKTVANLGKLTPAVLNAAANALDKEFEDLAREAKEFYVPVDKGDLQATIRKGPLRKGIGSAEVAVTAGGGDQDAKALAIHEHPSAHSPRSWKGKSATEIGNWGLGDFQRGPKYLSRPLNRSIANGRLQFRVMDAINKALGKIRFKF